MIHRRRFLGAAVLVAAAPVLTAAGAGAPKYRAAIIGHTGRGNFGHDLDLIFKHRRDVEVVAVADHDATGRARAAERSGAKRQYADYREMLRAERPQLVSVAPRYTDQHFEMIAASLEAGAHVYAEKPFTRTLAEADRLLAMSDQSGLRIAVAQQMRLAPSVTHLKRAVDGGLIGDLLQVRCWGKQDRRAGGEDMMVLGVHLFGLVRYFAGTPLWCTAWVRQNGRDITQADARSASEEIGLVAGDEIEAQFAFSDSVAAFFVSRARLVQGFGHWGLELIGSRGTALVLMDAYPRVYYIEPGGYGEHGRVDRWSQVPDDPTPILSADEKDMVAANRRAVDDWLEAIEQKRQPTCGGLVAMQSLEMVMAVYEAALSGGRASLPLVRREHPLQG
jgi:predicted dehydrogenase